MRTFEEHDNLSVDISAHGVQIVLNVFAQSQLACPTSAWQLSCGVSRNEGHCEQSDFLVSRLGLFIGARSVTQGCESRHESIQRLLQIYSGRPVGNVGVRGGHHQRVVSPAAQAMQLYSRAAGLAMWKRELLMLGKSVSTASTI